MGTHQQRPDLRLVPKEAKDERPIEDRPYRLDEVIFHSSGKFLRHHTGEFTVEFYDGRIYPKGSVYANHRQAKNLAILEAKITEGPYVGKIVYAYFNIIDLDNIDGQRNLRHPIRLVLGREPYEGEDLRLDRLFVGHQFLVYIGYPRHSKKDREDQDVRVLRFLRYMPKAKT